jgi:hypothetical protein
MNLNLATNNIKTENKKMKEIKIKLMIPIA